jgi:hypothetical protein
LPQLLDIKADLRIQVADECLYLTNDEAGRLRLELPRLSILPLLPLSPRAALHLIRRLSKPFHSPFLLTVAGRSWLSWRHGRIKVHSWLLTFRALGVLLRPHR